MSLTSTYQNDISKNHKVDIRKDKIMTVQTDRDGSKINGVYLGFKVQTFEVQHFRSFKCKLSSCLAEVSSLHTAYAIEQHRFLQDSVDAQTRLNFCCSHML